ncbi:MAG: AraC family transcriptional regulator [Gemmatimonadaceae bacterium]
MSYRELAPPSHWSGSIECVWTSSRSIESAAAHTVLPDGAMDVIAEIDDDGDVQQLFAVGAMTKPFVATLSTARLVGIRFFPGVGGSALQTQAATLTDVTIPLGDVVLRLDAVRDAFRLLAISANDAGAFARLSNALSLGPRSTPSLIRAATRAIAQSPHIARIADLSKELGASRQHLARQFATHVGLTPKQFARICRVRALLHQSRRNHRGWSEAAASFGYSDQSHLISDVRNVTGLTPGEWGRETGSILPIAPVPTSRD